MVNEQNIDILIKKFTDIVSSSFKLQAVYLFGSYARGIAKEFSDIDLAVVSNDFEGFRFNDRNTIYKVIIENTYPELELSNIEVHPFKTEDFTMDDPFVAEILKTGRRIC